MNTAFSKQIRVALADDHELIRKSIAQMLEAKGMEVVADAGDGRELLQLISSKKPEVVLMDINMPGMNGIEATSWLNKNLPEVRVIALSMLNDEYNVIRMLREGARGYLVKNTKPDDLVQAIIDVHEKGFHFSELVSSRLLNSVMMHNNEPETITPSLLKAYEIEFLKLCCTERTYKEIAIVMGISPRTAEGYSKTLCDKLKLKTRVGLVLYAIRHGIYEAGN